MWRKVVTLAALLALATAGTAGAVAIGIGGFGGFNIPIVQDDSENGSMFGVRVPVNFTPLISAEAFYAASAQGDVDQDILGISYTRDGGEVSGFGANVLLGNAGPGLGFHFFGLGGIGSYTLKRDGVDDESEVGYNFGLGVGFAPVPKFEITLRGEFTSVQVNDAARNYANIVGGVSYYLFSLP
jgi:hypothetical protein